MESANVSRKKAEFFEFAQKCSDSKFSRIGKQFKGLLEMIHGDESKSKVHPFQIEAVLKVEEMLRNDQTRNAVTQPSLIVAPTGSGKSGMIVMLPYVLQSKKVLILTPSAIISNQLAEAYGRRQDRKNCFILESEICEEVRNLDPFLEDVKVISKSSEAIEYSMGNLVIVNAQKFGGKSSATLSMKYRNEVTIDNVEKFFADFDTLIVDEAHHYPADTWAQIVREFKKNPEGLNKKLVFLTATPFRLDSNGKKTHIVGIDRTAFTVTKERCIGSSIRQLEFGINRRNPEEYKFDIKRTLEYQETIENRYIPQAMVLVKGRSDVSRIVKELNSLCEPGYAVALTGPTRTIAQNLKDFTAGKYRVAVTCKVGLEGYDNTKVTLCLIMRKIVTGKIMFSQFVGRCMRIKRGLEKINGEEVSDRNVGIVYSYDIYEQEKLMREYENMDGVIAGEVPANENDDDDE